MKMKKNKKGYVALEALIFFIVLVGLITILLSNTVVLTLMNSIDRVFEVQGVHLANAGIEVAKDNIIRASTRTQNLKFETGVVVVKIKNLSPSYRIESTAYIPGKENPQEIVQVKTTIKKSGSRFKTSNYEIKYGGK